VASSASALIPLAPLKRHDEYTFVHTINVAILSISLGEAVGLNDQAVYELSIGALLHDVGKQAIPKEILSKHGLFTPEERQLMEIHPIEGARMLINTPGVPELAAVVAYEHHIRADGGGYPRVPNQWRLNLASRIVQLADVFDALRTNRPYRPGLPLPKIVELMKAEVGSFFDADLVKVFFEQVVARGIPSPANVD
jgi:putative nucleotidyltransferase with HDIG domain